MDVSAPKPLWWALCLLVLTGCGDNGPDPDDRFTLRDGFDGIAEPYLNSRDFRRATLEESLVDPTNGYSQLRLEKYAVDGDWEDAQEFAPRVAWFTADDIGGKQPTEFEPSWDQEAFDDRVMTHERLVALGKVLFEHYPLGFDLALEHGVSSEQAVETAGFWRDDRGRIGGLLRVELPDNRESLAQTCSTCHGSTKEPMGALIYGRTNANYDFNAMVRSGHGLPGSEWGPGQVDVTADEVVNAAAIIDIRSIRYQRRLHWAATLYNSPAALAVRIETLLITSFSGRLKPPKGVALALAYYFWSLGAEEHEPLTGRGREVFQAECLNCHGIDGWAGPPVALEVIGTDRAVGDSTSRGTGVYRAPSLYGVGDRSQFLHDGSIESLEELLSPARAGSGHEFGLELQEPDRQALLGFLKSL